MKVIRMGLLPDITGLLDDSDVGGGQQFTIIRTTVPRKNGRADVAHATQERIPATGSVQPSGVDALEQLPEGDRENAEFIVRTTTPIQNGSSSGSAEILQDEVEYLGVRYKLLKTKEWQQWGMYVGFFLRSPPSAASNVTTV